MKPDVQNPRKAESRCLETTPTQIFAALAAERRQHALCYLGQKAAAISLGDLAEYIAIKEGDPSYEWYQRITVDLYHRHLPHLADAGLIEYDVDSELVELAIDRRAIDPYLRLTELAD